MSRIFLSHSHHDNRQAIALKRWLVAQDSALEGEIFLDLDPRGGILPGQRWKDALRQAVTRCEAVICLLSADWEASSECRTEFRTAESLNKPIIPVRLDDTTDKDVVGEWQWVDLFGAGAKTEIDIDDGEPVAFLTEGLVRLWHGIDTAGIGPESFPWPPDSDPGRAPYRGWAPLEQVDAAVFFGRDAQIVRGLDALRGMRKSQVETLFVIPGPSGAGKSSFLRAGLVPRLHRDDHNFLVLDIVRPERNVLTGDNGLARAIHSTRTRLGLRTPLLGEIKAACLGDAARVYDLLLDTQRAARTHTIDLAEDFRLPTLLIPVDQGEELFGADAGPEARLFLDLIGQHAGTDSADRLSLIVAVTIRTDHSEALQTAPELTKVESVAFHDLRPLPRVQFIEVIAGPARRSTDAGHPVQIEPALIEQLLADSNAGADTLPLLSLTLARLYEEYLSDGQLTLASYERMGRLRNVVETEIETLLSLDDATRQGELRLLRKAFIPWLATIDLQTDQAVRRVARWTDLPAESRPLLEKFVTKRLLVRNSEPVSGDVAEVALESLFRQWTELKGWLDDERENLKRAEALERIAEDWRSQNHNQAWLISGTRLREAEELAGAPDFQRRLEVVRDYLAVSRETENAAAQEKERVRQAELQAERDRAEAAQEREKHAQELTQEANSRQAEAEAHTATLHKRTRVLWVALASTTVVAIVAAVAVVGFARSNMLAQERFRDATSLNLVADAEGILGVTRPGTDTRAIQEILAARAISNKFDDGVLYSAAVQKANAVKIIQASGQVSQISYNPAAQRIAYASTDGSVHLLDAQTGRTVGQPLANDGGWDFAVQFSPDGIRIAAGGDGGKVKFWDAASGQPAGELRADRLEVRSIAFSPDGSRLVTAGADGQLRLWNTSDQRQIGSLVGHEDKATSVVFSRDGRYIVSGSHDRTVRIWDADTLTEVGEPLKGHTSRVLAVALSPDGHLIASCGSDQTIRLWDTATRTSVGDPLTAPDGCLSLQFSDDGQRFVTGLGNGTIRIWDVASRTPIGDPLAGHQGPVDAVALDPSGTRLFSGSRDGTVRIWDPNIDQPMPGHTGNVYSVAFRAGGHRIASGSEDESVRLWDADTGRPVTEPLTGHDAPVYEVTFSHDGRLLASSSTAGWVRIWDPGTGDYVRRMQHTDDPSLDPTVSALAFAPDGYLLASGGFDHTVRLWDGETGHPVGGPLTGPKAANWLSVAFSPDGRLLAGGSTTGSIQFWDVQSHKPVGDPLKGHEESVESVSFSPDGHLLASASRDGTVRFWNANTRKPDGAPLEGHHGMVFSVAFSPDGKYLAVGNADNTVQLWDVEKRKPFGDPLRGHSGWVRSVQFSDDGKRLVSGSFDKTVRMWPAVASADDLCNKLTANMTRDDWNKWVSPDIGYVKVCDGLPGPD